MAPFVLFRYGFRPFFLLAGAFAALAIPAWLLIFASGEWTFGALPAMYWHAHEMLYGFIGAAIAGFLLTAVPSWTGARGFAGRPLMWVAAAWFAGRIGMACAGSAPFALVAIAELAFLPILAGLLAPPLLRAHNRNTPLLGVLGALWLLDGVFLSALRTGDLELASRAITLAIDFVLVLVTIIGGRIVPAFTASGLRQLGRTSDVVSRKLVDAVTIALMIAVAAADLVGPHTRFTGVIAAFAALAHLVRMSGWRSLSTRGEPILWVLHVAYAWLPLGLALKACWLLAHPSWAMHWKHALVMGVFATMILAVMTRASLGHTGRPLKVARSIAAAYLVLALAAVIRVFGPALWPQGYIAVLTLAGAAWCVSFALYLRTYAPILVSPRVDGRPG